MFVSLTQLYLSVVSVACGLPSSFLMLSAQQGGVRIQSDLEAWADLAPAQCEP